MPETKTGNGGLAHSVPTNRRPTRFVLCPGARCGARALLRRTGERNQLGFPYTLSARFSKAAEKRAKAASNIEPINNASIRLLNS
jgi:hypothetical protein